MTASATPTAADGQPLGERGIRTRQRILEAVGRAVQEHGLRGVRLADIARQVGFKPPAFYQYFADIDEAILALCADAGELIPHFDTDTGRPFVEEFFAYWDDHRSLLTARHSAVMAGDARFQEAANESFRPVAEALQERIREGQAAGRIDAGLHPVALGAVLNLMLDTAAMVGPAITGYWDADDTTELTEAVAYVFDRVLGTPG